MRCTICGDGNLLPIRYRTHAGSCPAFACATCQAVHLDERAATTAEEAESVREIKAARECIGLGVFR